MQEEGALLDPSVRGTRGALCYVLRVDGERMSEASDPFLDEALREAELGLAEGGIPIAALLVIDGAIVARGRNRRIQSQSAILHAEMDCLEHAGRLRASQYARATLVTTLSPCDMCSGAILLYRIPRVVIGENRTFRGPEDWLVKRGVELVLLQEARCRKLMEDFVRAKPDLWREDIGLEDDPARPSLPTRG